MDNISQSPSRLFSSLSMILIAVFIAKLLLTMDVGIDLTDEGYYLNWISNPWIYKYYVSQFGYIYHPIYQWLGNDFVLLRIFNAILTYGLGFAASLLIIKRLSSYQSRQLLFLLSACIALSSLFILMITGHWLPTPSYNSLCFQGLLITVIGLFLSDDSFKYHQIISGFLIGLGGWLVFMAKPSSALILSVVVLLNFAFNLRNYWCVLVVAFLTAMVLLIMSALYIDGSLWQFVQRYLMGFKLLESMRSKHGLENLLRLDLFKVSIADQYKFLFLTGFITCLLICFDRGYKKVKTIAAWVLCLSIVVILFKVFSNVVIKVNTPRYHPLSLLSILFAVLIFSAIFKKSASSVQKIPNKFLLTLLIIPYIYAIGTGNNYWETAAGAILCWMLAAVLILHKTSTNQTVTIVLSILVASLSTKVILDAQNSPYRQTETIAQQTSNYINPHTHKYLMLPKDTAAYLIDLSHLLAISGFKKDTPVIDFTGHHPGTLYFMQANAIGQAWTIGGYDGSNAMAALALNQATCHEIANAWLIIEKDGRRRIDSKILEQHGIQADKTQYQKVGMIKTKMFTDWGFRDQSHLDARYEQYFLKPINPKSQEKNCVVHRQKGLAPQL